MSYQTAVHTLRYPTPHQRKRRNQALGVAGAIGGAFLAKRGGSRALRYMAKANHTARMKKLETAWRSMPGKRRKKSFFSRFGRTFL